MKTLKRKSQSEYCHKMIERTDNRCCSVKLYQMANVSHFNDSAKQGDGYLTTDRSFD